MIVSPQRPAPGRHVSYVLRNLTRHMVSSCTVPLTPCHVTRFAPAAHSLRRRYEATVTSRRDYPLRENPDPHGALRGSRILEGRPPPQTNSKPHARGGFEFVSRNELEAPAEPDAPPRESMEIPQCHAPPLTAVESVTLENRLMGIGKKLCRLHGCTETHSPNDECTAVQPPVPG